MNSNNSLPIPMNENLDDILFDDFIRKNSDIILQTMTRDDDEKLRKEIESW